MGLILSGIQTPGFMGKGFMQRCCLDHGLYLVKGPNGTGKSVFLNSLIGFYGQPPDIVKDNGEKAVVSYFNQDSYAATESAYWNLFLGHASSPPSWADPGRAVQLLAAFGMAHVVSGLDPVLSPGLLSGGQLKKLGLIRTLLRPADLVLLDEPTNDLDQQSVHVLLEHLRQLAMHACVVAVTHDRSFESLPHRDLSLFDD